MAGELTNTSFTTDQEKFLAVKLIRRSYLKLVMGSLCDKVQMAEGAGLTAYFVRYKRMNVPVAALADDGQDPANSSFSVDGANVTLDEWGDVVTITNVAQLTTKHPLMQQATALLADNAARVMDREITLVVLAGTNVQYGSGSATSRSTLTAGDVVTQTVLNKALITMVDNGAPPRGNPAGDATQLNAQGQVFSGAYVAVCGPQVLADIRSPGVSLGTWAAAATYANAKAMYSAEVGMWNGIRWVESNFLPKFTMIGNTTVAIVSAAAGASGMPVITAVGSGGTLQNQTFFFKVTRKDLTRGFEEAISIAHSMATGAGSSSMTFAMPATAGYVYNVYFDSVATGGTGTDATMLLAASNVAAGATATITANPAGTAAAPANVNADGTVSTVYPIFIFAEECLNWVGFYNIKFHVTQNISIPGNVLMRRRSAGYTFFGKAMIRDQTRILRVEVASTY